MEIRNKDLKLPSLFNRSPKPYANLSIISRPNQNLSHLSQPRFLDISPISIRKYNDSVITFVNSEYSVEKIMGSKKRIESLDKQRNFLKFANPGDKEYSSPERSEGFFKKSFIFNSEYSKRKRKCKKSLRQQLGKVNGIFTEIMKNVKFDVE